MILNQEQAEAVYSAMCALNNVGDVSSTFDLPNDVWVQATARGAVNVSPRTYGAKIEVYDSQAAFATAYGLTT